MQSPTIPIPGVSEVDFAVDDSSHDVLHVTSCSIGDVIMTYCSCCSYKFLQIFFKNVLCLSKYFLLKFESSVCVCCRSTLVCLVCVGCDGTIAWVAAAFRASALPPLSIQQQQHSRTTTHTHTHKQNKTSQVSTCSLEELLLWTSLSSCFCGEVRVLKNSTLNNTKTTAQNQVNTHSFLAQLLGLSLKLKPLYGSLVSVHFTEINLRRDESTHRSVYTSSLSREQRVYVKWVVWLCTNQGPAVSSCKSSHPSAARILLKMFWNHYNCMNSNLI